jgi:transcriptional regulator with XRE-family HTH domain
MKSVNTEPNPLRAVREANGYTLQEVSERAGVHMGHLSRVERGLDGFSVGALARVARVLGLRDLYRHLRPFIKDGRR